MTTLDHFIQELFERVERKGPFVAPLAGIDILLGVMLDFYNYRRAHDISTDGLDSRFTEGGQEGEAWRHIRFHAGCILLGWPFGSLISKKIAQMDEKQALSGRLESKAEVLGNMAGCEVGRLLRLYIKREMTRKETAKNIHQTLAVPASAD